MDGPIGQPNGWDGPRKSRVSTLRPMFRNDNRVYLDTKQVYLSVVVFESASPIVWGHLVEHMNNFVALRKFAELRKLARRP